MLHFLWLGALVGLAAPACRLLLRRASAEVRYVVALTSLTVLAALPIGIGAWLVATPQVADRPWRAETLAVADVPPDGEIIELKGREPLPSVETAPGSAGGIVANDGTVQNAAPTNPERPNPRQSRGLTDVMTMLEACVPYLPWLWLVGTPLTFALLATGVVGAERLRRASRVVEDGPIAEACARLARSLGVTRRVTVAACERIAAPVLVGILRPIILLPPAALTGWSPDEIEMVLLHELAHVRRWDNLVNLVQRLIESLLFFHPAVWLLSGWVRREREACCDALVVARTQRPHAYAELLLALASQLSEPGRPRPRLFHPAAVSAMAAGRLRARIRRILQLEDDPMLISGKSFALVLATVFVSGALVVLNLPTVGQAEESTTEATETTEPNRAAVQVDSTNNLIRPMTAELPYSVQFEQGASRFLDGDNINVIEVRGTARAFEPGHIYLIKGTYTLASHDRAQFYAGSTAKDAAHGKGPIWRIQTTLVNRGQGTFELFLPMSYAGWPHVSFYPAEGGDGFGGTYFGTGDAVLKKWWGSDGSADPAATSTAAGPRSSRFPALEDQKLADLAWRMLQLELEPIGEEDLKRVQAMGYEGGVKVVKAPMLQDGIWTSDALVGLHVWPTTSLQDVAQVLNRADLDELNPLKFYVIRQPNVSTQKSPTNVVITGRISANLERRGRSATSAGKTGSDPRFIDALVDKQMEADPQAQMLRNELMMAQMRLAEMAKRGRGTAASAQLKRQIADVQKQLDQYRAQLKQSISDRIGDAADPSPEDYPNDIDRPKAVTLELRTETQPGSPADDTSATEAGSAPTTSVAPWGEKTADRYPAPSDRTNETAERSLLVDPSAPDHPTKPQAAEENRENLRYDGKPFDEWRTIWRNELSTERRLEAAKALAAFGAAGYGKEAAETILDVAGEYDFRRFYDRDSTMGQLQSQVAGSLAAGPGIDPTITFLMIRERYQASPDKWHGLLAKFLLNRPKIDASASGQVRALLEHKDADLRAAALAAFVARDPAAGAAAVKAALADPDSLVVSKAIEILVAQESLRREAEQGNAIDASQIEFPVTEFVPLLLRTDPARVRGGQLTAFDLLRWLSAKTTAQLVSPLTEVLNDASRAADHLTAIRALGAIGEKAAAATPDLERVFNESQDLRVRVAAAFALDRLNPGGMAQYQIRVMNMYDTPPTDDREERADRRNKQEEVNRLYNEEQRLTR